MAPATGLGALSFWSMTPVTVAFELAGVGIIAAVVGIKGDTNAFAAGDDKGDWTVGRGAAPHPVEIVVNVARSTRLRNSFLVISNILACRFEMGLFNRLSATDRFEGRSVHT